MREGKGTILVLDDEPSLRLLCRVNLELEGYRVLEAASLEQARTAIDDEPVDAALLDMHVGPERGLDLLPELRALEPPAAVVVLSGTSEVNPETRARVDGVLGKPFVLDELIGTVARVLAGSAAVARVSAVAVRTPLEFEERLSRYVFERSEEARAVRVGEKEVSEQAAIVQRYRDLFTGDQLDALRTAEEGADGVERERLSRLRRTCEAGIVAAELAERRDELENAELAARIPWRGEELPLRTAQAQLALLPDYVDRDELGRLHIEATATFNDDRRELLAAEEALSAELSGEPDAVARHDEEKGISLRELAAVLAATRADATAAWEALRQRWLDRLLGDGREDVPSSAHSAWLRRLSPLEAVYPRDRCVPVCLATLARLGFELERDPGIRLDLDDRPQKSPRACVIASDPPTVVHLITRAQGGLHDYQAFLHEAGHALHYAGCDPSLPYTFRKLARDHALTEIYSYIVEAISREPLWHAEHFGLADDEAMENAEATTFLEAFLFRRYSAKLDFELDFWSRFAEDGGTPDGYAERLTEATGLAYPPANHLADMDAGFYSADYLRAWIRAAQLRDHLRREIGEDWWRRSETGDLLRELFQEGTRPSSEEIAGRLGREPLDTKALLAELVAA